jgi:hypothetical protein
MRRFLICCAAAMLLAGCGTMKGQQANRSFFGATDRPALTTRDDASSRETTKPRESFFRRVLFGRSSER